MTRIRVGDLVRLKNIPAVLRTHHHEGITAESVGLVLEWNIPGASNAVNFATGSGGDGGILWNGRRDWDIEYAEDLEIVNESRS